ncbi:alpha/beta hydrolase [Xanthobacter wiegelii]|uniref:alpha/beta hydrolase n=1 Tax=Xanthobacter wiegelii TaxID=3119913 RepID=UPI0037285FDC
MTALPLGPAATARGPLSFTHRFVPATDPSAAPLLLLHGTGGDENDLLPLGRMLSPGAALLSPRGKISEGGMPRFFRRLAEGVFDEEDVVRRANELADFIGEARDAYGLAAPVAVGFSNGANIAAAMLMLRPDALSGAALLRAMVPLANPPAGSIAGTPVLLLSGSADPIVPAANAARLAAQLGARGARVEHRVLPGGHGLMPVDMSAMRDWLARTAPAA